MAMFLGRSVLLALCRHFYANGVVVKALAIDFETANEERASPCAIGLAWIEEGSVTRRDFRLIRPKELRFLPQNISIHGIRPDDVQSMPEFPEVLESFLPDIRDRLVLAHNAAFDIEVLCATLKKYGEPLPQFSFFCTEIVAKIVWPNLGRWRLPDVARYLGIEFRHHFAADDAFACAQVALAAAAKLEAPDILGLCGKLSIHPGTVAANEITQCWVSGAPVGISNAARFVDSSNFAATSLR